MQIQINVKYKWNSRRLLGKIMKNLVNKVAQMKYYFVYWVLSAYCSIKLICFNFVTVRRGVLGPSQTSMMMLFSKKWLRVN